MAIMMTTAIFAAAENNESENTGMNAAEAPETTVAAEAPETNVAEVILNDIDPVVSSHFYVNEDREIFFVEVGNRFIRVKDFPTGKLVSTISRYLSEEAGIWVENADCVMQYQGQFLPAKRILNGKGITYCAAKHRQWVPMNRVRSVEKEFRISL